MDDVPVKTKAYPGMSVVLCWSLVDDHVGNPALCCHQGKGRGGVYREGRSQGYYQIRLVCGIPRPVKVLLSKVLAETDCGCLEDSTTGASRRTTMGFEEFKVRIRITSGSTRLALDFRVRAVEFNKTLR